jgi:predicted SAM-dependent methyltransferase
MKLHIGCGDVILDGWINIDSRKLPGVDLVTDGRWCPEHKPETIDEIYACHVIDHFYAWEVESVVYRWCRLLKPAGRLFLSTPDWDQIVSHYNWHCDLNALAGCLYARQDYESNVRKCIFNGYTLWEMLRRVGFVSIQAVDVWPSGPVGVDDCSQYVLDGELLSLNVIAQK